MKCNDFWKKFHEKGLTPELDKHLKSCSSCREEIRIEGLLEDKLKDYPSYQAPGSLWESINEELENDSFIRQEDTDGNIQSIYPKRNWKKIRYFAAAAAAVIFIILAGLNHSLFTDISESDKDLQAALENIEEAENDYIAAIDRFTAVIENKKDELVENSLYQLYTEKLALLDVFILECKEAIEQNELNVNARTYLILAYRDKVETLEAISKLI